MRKKKSPIRIEEKSIHIPKSEFTINCWACGTPLLKIKTDGTAINISGFLKEGLEIFCGFCNSTCEYMLDKKSDAYIVMADGWVPKEDED